MSTTSGWWFGTFFPTSLCGGSCFWFCIPGSSPPPRLLPHPAASSSHTSFTHHLCQPSLSTIIFHTIFHTPSLTHHLSHTSLSTTIFHAPSFTHHLSHITYCHTPSFTHHLCQPHIFHTPSFTHHLSHTISHTHTSLSTTIFHTPSFTHTIFYTHHLCQPHIFANHHLSTLRGRRGTWSTYPPSFCVAGVALMALGWLRWRAWSLGSVAGDAAALCVAGVALGDIHLRFTWQALALGDTGLALVALLRWD